MLYALCALLLALIFKHLHPFLKSVYFILSIFSEAVYNSVYVFFLCLQGSVTIFGKEYVGIAVSA